MSKWSDELLAVLGVAVPKNYTKEYFFTSRARNWERVHGLFSRYASQKTPNEAFDLASEYLMELIDKDTLAPFLEKGEKIKDSVLLTWFGQFMIRRWMVYGKDAHMRAHMGVKSQAEQKNGKDYTLTASEVVNVSVQKDEEGAISSVDYYYEGYKTDAERAVEEEDMKKQIYDRLTANFGDRAEYYISIYETEMEGKYDTRVQWAEAWKVPYRDLTVALGKIKSALNGIEI